MYPEKPLYQQFFRRANKRRKSNKKKSSILECSNREKFDRSESIVWDIKERCKIYQKETGAYKDFTYQPHNISTYNDKRLGR